MITIEILFIIIFANNYKYKEQLYSNHNNNIIVIRLQQVCTSIIYYQRSHIQQ